MRKVRRRPRRGHRARGRMRFFLKDGDSDKELLVTELSNSQLWQASAISDGIARMIPHEGIDYDIKVQGAFFEIIPITDKGTSWRDYVNRMLDVNPPEVISSKIDVSLYLCRLIPEEGVDYDVRIVYKAPGSRNLKMDILVMNERGKFWKSYVMSMIRKYPPTTTYESFRLPEEAEEVEEVPKEFEEGGQDEKVMS